MSREAPARGHQGGASHYLTISLSHHLTISPSYYLTINYLTSTILRPLPSYCPTITVTIYDLTLLYIGVHTSPPIAPRLQVRVVSYNYARTERTFFDDVLEADFKKLEAAGPPGSEVSLVRVRVGLGLGLGCGAARLRGQPHTDLASYP